MQLQSIRNSPAAMYLCNCNGLSEKEINEIADSGVAAVGSLFRCLDCRPQCGKCVPEIRSIIDETRQRRSSARKGSATGGTHEGRQGSHRAA
jgi:bacterioferritin-associated ferredoxin